MSQSSSPQIPAEVFRQFRNGNEQAFNQVFEALYSPLCYYCMQYIDQLEVAEEIASEAFVKCWTHRQSIRDDQAIRSFLYRVARNACIDEIRKISRQIGFSLESGTDIPSTDPNGADLLLKSELYRQLYDAIDSLPRQCRTVFSLQYREGRSLKEIADEMKISVNSVKKYKSRGLAQLRKNLLSLFKNNQRFFI